MDESVNNSIALVTAIPLAAGIVLTLLRGRLLAQRVVGCVSLVVLLALNVVFCLTLPSGSGLHVSALGGWPAPFGISAVYDGLSGTLLLVTSIVALGCYAAAFSMLPRRVEAGWFHPLFHLMIMGVNFSFMTGDLFNLFVAFEIMLMASYALLVIGGERAQLSQAYKYVLLNLLGSTTFVLSAGLMYGMMGTLNYADLARMVAEAGATGEPLPPAFGAVSLLLLLVFAVKAAVFPLWFWLPDTYHTMPTPISACFAALLSKVGVYAILRLHPMVFGSPLLAETSVASLVIPAVAILTMLLAIVGAIGAHRVRRILAMVLMSHVGYLLFGVVLMTGPAHSATLWYMAQEMVVIAGLFLACGMIEKHAGSDDLNDIAGLHRRAPALGWLTFVLLLALAGMPPLAGFYAKAMLVREGVAEGRWAMTAATLLTAVVTLLAILRIWCHGFWMPMRGSRLETPAGAEAVARPSLRGAFVGVWLLTIVTLVAGIGAPIVAPFTASATAELTRPQRYVDTILGEASWPADEEGEASVAAVEDEEEGSP